MSRQEIEDRVAEYVEQTEQGHAVDPTTYARRFPSIERELLAALWALQATESLLPRAADEIPSSVGPYRVLGEIGSGGMGRVLRVAAPGRTGPDLALKLLHPFAALDPRSTERLRREGEMLKSLAHPNIVKVHEVGLFGSTPFLVMDRVEGRSLAQVIREARARRQAPGTHPCDRLELPGNGSGPQRVARIVAALSRAVAAVHAAGALHRDIKPANVILRADGEPILVDFGLVHCSAGATLTRTGDLLGTPQYMPPEQARGEAADERADVYGLGALLYELLALEPVHGGRQAMEVLESVKRRPVVPLRVRSGDVPDDLTRVAARALAYRAHWRTSSAAALAEDLERFLAGKAVAARAPGLAERLDALWTFKKPALAVAAAIVAGGIGLAAYMSRHEATERVAADVCFDRALRAWLERDDATALAAARETLGHRSNHRWAAVLAAIAEKRNPDASTDAAVAAVAEGWRQRAAGDHAAALAAFARAADAAPGDAFPVVLLGFEAQLAGEQDQAERELSAAVRLVPRSGRLLEELGNALVAKREYAAAQGQFEAVVELDPLNARAWESLARSRFRLGRFAPGLEAAERAHRLAGDAAPARLLMTYGALLDVHGRRAEAQEMFERAARREPASSQPPISLAMSLDSDHKLREAQDEYWRAAQLGPPAKALMCLAYLYSGSRSQDCADCRSYFESNPDLLDADRAESCALRALEADAGREPGVPPTAAIVANQIHRRDAIRAAMVKLRDAATDDALIARYEKALRMLRED